MISTKHAMSYVNGVEMLRFKPSQKFTPRPKPSHTADGRGNNCTIEVISAEPDAYGKIDVYSVNHFLGMKRCIHISAKRLLSSAYKAISIIAIFFIVACASAPKKADTTAQCNGAPQWTTKDTAGNAIGIFICFGEENHLLYTTRILPTPPTPLSTASGTAK